MLATVFVSFAQEKHNITFHTYQEEYGVITHIAGANVILDGDALFTNVSGLASFLQVSGTTLANYSVYKNGYLPLSDTLENINSDREVSVHLKSSNVQTGLSVQDQTDNFVENAKIEIQGKTVYTDEMGNVTLDSVPGGKWINYTLTKPKYQTVIDSLFSDYVWQNVDITMLKDSNLAESVLIYVTDDVTTEFIGNAMVVIGSDISYSGNDSEAADYGLAYFWDVPFSNQQNIEIVKDGYVTMNTQVDIDDQFEEFSFMLTKQEYATSVGISVYNEVGPESLSNAMVILGQDTSYTDNVGTGYVEFSNVPYNSQLPITISYKGFNTYNGTVDINEENEYFDFYLTETQYANYVQILVKDENSLEYLDSAMVILGQDTLFTGEIVTGMAEFYSVPYGNNINLSVEIEGYYFYQSQVSINEENEYFELYLSIQPSGLTFLIIDSITNDPIVEAFVSIKGDTYTTDINGYFTYWEPDMIGTNQSYSIAKNLYNPISGSVYVTDEYQVEVIKMIPNVTISTVSFEVKRAGSYGSLYGVDVTFNGQTQKSAGQPLVFEDVPFGDSVPVVALNLSYLDYYDTLTINSPSHNFILELELDTINSKVSFKTLDVNGRLENAMIVVKEDTLYSNSYGSVDRIKLAKGQYHEYYAFKEGYYPMDDSIYISEFEDSKYIYLTFERDTSLNSLTFITEIDSVRITIFNDTLYTTGTPPTVSIDSVEYVNNVKYTAFKPGFKILEDSVDLNLYNQVEYLSLVPDTMFSYAKFMVTSAHGPVLNAKIVSGASSDLSFELYTDSLGEALLKVMEYNDSIHFSISKNGYKTITMADKLISDSTIQINATLECYIPVSFQIISNDNPIENASIIIENDTLITNSQGTASTFVFEPKVYPYSIIASGYNQILDSIDITLNGANITHNLIESVYDVKFTIVENNIPIANAIISFDSDFQNTNEEGIAQFTERAKGNYSYLVSKDNYKDTIGNFEITNENVELLINLKSLVDISDINSTFILYPNPVGAELNIIGAEGYSYKLHSINGTAILNGKIDNSRFKLNTSAIKAGIYFVTLENNDNLQFFKIVKQ